MLRSATRYIFHRSYIKRNFRLYCHVKVRFFVFIVFEIFTESFVCPLQITREYA